MTKFVPVLLIPLADWDFRKILNNAERLDEFDDFVTNFFEVILNAIKEQHINRKENAPITQLIIIVDVKDYPYLQLINYRGLFVFISRFSYLASLGIRSENCI